MTDSARDRLGRFGVWRRGPDVSPEFAAGVDHVAVQVLTAEGEDPLETLGALAAALPR